MSAFVPARALPWLEIGTVDHQRAAVASTPRVLQRWVDVEGRLVASGSLQDGRWVMDWPGLGRYTFTDTGRVTVFPLMGADPALLYDAFLRGVLPVAMLACGHEALHASAVGYRGGVVAFCARSGTGKSSLALALAAAGAPYWADDTLVLDGGTAGPQVLSLSFQPRVDSAARQAIGGLGVIAPPVAPGTSAPLGRLYLLTRDESLDPDDPVVAEVPPARALERLLAHAHPFDLAGPGRRRQMLERLMSVARLVRMFDVRFAPRLRALPALADAVRRHLASD